MKSENITGKLIEHEDKSGTFAFWSSIIFWIIAIIAAIWFVLHY